MVEFIQFVVLTFESVDVTHWCDHSNEASSALVWHDTINLLCSFQILSLKMKCHGVTNQMKPFQSVVTTNEIQWCGHSNKTLSWHFHAVY